MWTLHDWFLCPESHQDEIKGVGWAVFSSRSSTEEESGSRLIHIFLAESCSSGWGSCLPAIDKKLLSAPKRCSHSLTQWPRLSSKPAVKNCLYIKSLTLCISSGTAQSLFKVSPDNVWHIHNNLPFLKSSDQRPWFCFSLSWLFNAWYKFIWVWEKIGVYKLSLQAIWLCRIKWFHSVVSDACLVLQKWNNS